MSKEAVIGIDLGTTVLKAAAFDKKSGKPLALVSRKLLTNTAPDGTREQDPAAIDRALEAVLRSIAGRLGARSRITGLGVAAQGGSTVIADRRTGEALTPMILWNDLRHLGYVPRILNIKPASYWNKLGMREGPGSGLARMLWLRERKPSLFSEHNIYAGAGEYIFFKLTGLWQQDAGNALQIGCYDALGQKLATDALNAIGINGAFVAPMRQGHSTCELSKNGASLTGAEAGMPVAGPYMDHEAGYMAALHSGCPLQCSLGTAWVGNFVMANDAKFHSPVQLVLPSPVDNGRLVVLPMAAGDTAWNWALEHLAGGSFRQALRNAEETFRKRLLPLHNLVCLPWVTRTNPVTGNGLGAGCFTGIGTHTDRADMLRAVAMGLCCDMLRMLKEVVSWGIVDRVMLSGGASKGAHFRHALAALFSPLPVFTIKETDISGPCGAVYPFTRKAAPWVRIRKPSKSVVEAAVSYYRGYVDTYDRLMDGETAGQPFVIHQGGRQCSENR